MAIEARCPNCDDRFELADHLAGKMVICRTCKDKFKVPSRDEPTYGLEDTDDEPQSRSQRRNTPEREPAVERRPKPRRRDPEERPPREDDAARQWRTGDWLATGGVILGVVLIAGVGSVLFVAAQFGSENWAQGSPVPVVSNNTPTNPVPNPVVPVIRPNPQPPVINPNPLPPQPNPNPPRLNPNPPVPMPMPPPKTQMPADAGRVPAEPVNRLPTAPARFAGVALKATSPTRPMPEPSPPSATLAGTTLKDGNARFQTLALAPSLLAPSLAWHPEGRSYYVAEKSGAVHRVDAAQTKGLARIDLGGPVGNLAVSELGLVVSMPQHREIYLLEPETLAVVKRFALPQVPTNPPSLTAGLELAAAPASSTVFVAAGLSNVEAIFRLDVKTGDIRAFTTRDFGRAPVGFKGLAMTDDGKFLFTSGGGIARFRIDPTALTLEDANDYLGSNPRTLCLAGDGRWVCLPCGGGNTSNGYVTLMYGGLNLRQPEFGLRTSAYPQALGFDTKTGTIYAQNHDLTLMVFDAEGRPRSAHRFAAAGSTQAIIPYPGGAVLLRTENHLGLVQLPAE